MDRVRVSSSNLHSVGYDAKNMVLGVEFVAGTLYRYSSVPSDIHERLMRAASKGSYFDTHIKDRYRYRRIR